MAVVGGRVLTKMAGTTWLSRMNLSLLFTSSHACNSLKYRINGVFLQALIPHAMFCSYNFCITFMCNISMQEPISLRNALFLN